MLLKHNIASEVDGKLKLRERYFNVITVSIICFLCVVSIFGVSTEVYAQKIEDYATIEAYSDDVPVYAFGFTYVYGVSPDFLPGTVLQTGNSNPRTKIQPKKSWEIKESKMGVNPASVPRTPVNDIQPFQSIHLIDSDVETCWSSRAQIQPDVEDVWIRIDLPREGYIRSVSLVPHPKGQADDDEENVLFGRAFPKQLTIKLSRDAWHWETVYENKNFCQSEKVVTQKFAFEPRLAKQIWIIGRECPQVLSYGHCFSIAEVEVEDTNGNNKASITKGAAVTVSSTYYGNYTTDRFTQDMLWPIQYDLGFKWMRVGHGKDVFTWAFVERVKGVLQLDSRADAAITEAVQNGINVIMILNKGREYFYVKEPKVFDGTQNAWVFPLFWERHPNPNESGEALQHYLDYVRFMVRHFKDRVKYFEVWNEWDDGAEEFCKFFIPAVKVIREECPEAKIVTGSTSPGETISYILETLDIAGPIFDVVGWHLWYNPDPTTKDFLEYLETIRKLKKECAARGFKGQYMSTEWTWCAPYPPTAPTGDDAFSNFRVTEIQKAKYAARMTITQLALDVHSFWCELFRQQAVQLSIGLLRNSFSGSPICPTQPEPIYYILRTMSSVMDETTPAEANVQFSTGGGGLEWYTLKKSDGRMMLAVWLKGYAKDDDSQEIITDITFLGRKLNKVSAIDVLNGDSQDLNIMYNKKNTVINGIHIKDWPIVISGFEL